MSGDSWLGPGSRYTRRPTVGLDYLPSLAVLPFRSDCDEIITAHFLDGVTVYITDSLARSRELLVLSADSVLTFRGSRFGPRMIGSLLDVGYLLDGEIVRRDQNLTFVYRLIATESGEQLWSDSVAANIDHVFDLQRQIVGRVVNSLQPHIRTAEIDRLMRQQPKCLSAYDATLLALPAIQRLEQHGFDAAERLLDQAMRLDPQFAMPVTWRARMHSFRVGQGWSTRREHDIAQAIHYAQLAVKLDGDSSMALATAGHLNSYLLHHYDEALQLFDRAITACPNDALAHALSSATLIYCGLPGAARARVEHALRLSPMDPAIHQLYFFAALASYAEEDYQQAERWARRSLAENPKYTSGLKLLIAALAGQHRIADARELTLSLTLTSIPADRNLPIRDPALRQRLIAHWRQAGVLPAAPPDKA